uniref:Uncharacterized protein n=1 Tax=Salix viminalis TaxID=40686 RepID=A0A6N2N7T4_SALVM
MDIGSVVAELHRVRDILSGTRIRGQHEYVSVLELITLPNEEFSS